MNANSAAEFSLEIKFRVVELKTLRFSTAIRSNLYAEDRVEYYYYYYYWPIEVSRAQSDAAIASIRVLFLFSSGRVQADI